MHIRLLLIALTVCSSVQAADTTSTDPQIVQVTGTRLGEPMAWKYSVLQIAEDVFQKHEARLAPGAALTFKLPNVNEAQGDNVVEIVTTTTRIPLPMVSATVFALPHSPETVDDDAMVVVNRNFPKGSFRHPHVQVRSPGLAEGVKRMGDLRLACTVQVAMTKAHNLKFRAIVAAASLFGEICEGTKVGNIGAPTGPYDTMTIEDGDRKMTQPRSQEGVSKLGDKNWSNDARISYTLNGQIVY